ncbi:hypothetical protein BH11PSE8_BH11PSE8_15400 [soil metagenome]
MFAYASASAFCRTILACVLLAATAAHAADKPATKGKGNGPLLTRAELRECMAQPTRIAAEAEELRKQQAANETDKTQIVQQGDALKEQLATLDRTSAEAVAAYNEKAQARDARVDAYNAANAAINTRVEALQAQRNAYLTGCENRRYDEKDEIAIKNGK